MIISPNGLRAFKTAIMQLQWRKTKKKLIDLEVDANEIHLLP